MVITFLYLVATITQWQGALWCRVFLCWNCSNTKSATSWEDWKRDCQSSTADHACYVIFWSSMSCHQFTYKRDIIQQNDRWTITRHFSVMKDSNSDTWGSWRKRKQCWYHGHRYQLWCASLWVILIDPYFADIPHLAAFTICRVEWIYACITSRVLIINLEQKSAIQNQ